MNLHRHPLLDDEFRLRSGVQVVSLYQAWLQAPRAGNLSLVELSVPGVDDSVRNVAWIHWDDVGGQIGRFVRLDGECVVYSLPLEIVCRSMFAVCNPKCPRFPQWSCIHQ